jgi:competence protein ComGC
MQKHTYMKDKKKINNSSRIFVLTIIIIFLVISSLFIFTVFSKNKQENSRPQSESETSVQDIFKSSTNLYENSSPPSYLLTSNYEKYSEELLKQESIKNRVLFFKVNWCSSCSVLDENLEKEIQNIPSDTLILEVDFDTNIYLRQKYNVTSQHTLVQVDRNGKEIKKWVGSRNLEAILKELHN